MSYINLPDLFCQVFSISSGFPECSHKTPAVASMNETNQQGAQSSILRPRQSLEYLLLEHFATGRLGFFIARDIQRLELHTSNQAEAHQ